METSTIIEIAKIAPGIAGMAYLAWLMTQRANKSEEHVAKITESFLKHIDEKDKFIDKITVRYDNNQKDAQGKFSDMMKDIRKNIC